MTASASESNFSEKLRQLFAIDTRISEDSAEGAPLELYAME